MDAKPVTIEFVRNGKLDRRVSLTAAIFRLPSLIDLRFADDAAFALPIAKLQIPLDRIRWETATVASSGETIQLIGIRGAAIPIEAGLLRYLVDAGYAAEIDAEADELRLTREEMHRMAAENPPPPDWLREPAQVHLRD
jgi:hypothetical protein